jgi:hypothetical protein
MTTGDKVRVFPMGRPDKAAIAEVAILSSNGRSIAVGFDSRPPFPIGNPLSMAIHPEHGIMLFATRGLINGQPGGPWVEMMGGTHFEIEDAGSQRE